MAYKHPQLISHSLEAGRAEIEMLADSMSGESLFIDDIFVCLLAFLCLLRVAVTRGLCGTSFIFDKGTDPNHGGSVLMT